MDYRSPTPWLLGGVLVLAGVGAVHALTNPKASVGCKPTVQKGDRVLLIGDSLAVGLSAPLREICRRTGCEFEALAKTGTRMGQWLAGQRRTDLQSLINTYQPTLVLVSLGTNDSKSMLTNEQLAIEVRELNGWLSTHARVFWVRPPKLPFEDRVSPAVVAQGIPAFDSSMLPIPQADGIHPTGKGYAGWAEHMWASLSCSAAPMSALEGISAPLRPTVPAFMRPAVLMRPIPGASRTPRKPTRRRKHKTRWRR